MKRRNLFGSLIVAPIAAAGAVLVISRRNEAPTDSPHMHLALVNGAYGSKVAMWVGKDGHLWLKPNNKGAWLRVVTE